MVATPVRSGGADLGLVVVDDEAGVLTLVNDAAGRVLALEASDPSPADFVAALDQLVSRRVDGDPTPVGSFGSVDLGDRERSWHWQLEGNPTHLHVITTLLDEHPHRRLWVFNDTSRTHEALHRARLAINAMLDPDIFVAAVRDPAGTIVDFRFVEMNDAAVRFIATYLRGRVGTDGPVGEQRHALNTLNLVQASEAGVGQSLRDSGLFDILVGSLERHEPFVGEWAPTPIPGSAPRRIELRVNPVDDGLSMTWRDVTESHRQLMAITELQERLDRMFAVGPVLGAHFGSGGVVTWVSRSAEVILVRTAEELVGRDTREIVHPDDLAGLVRAVDLLRTTREPVPFEVRVLRPDRSIRHLQGRFFLPEAESGDFEAVFADVTERVEADQLRATVSSVASHELRTPIAFLHTCVTMLEDGTVDPASDTGRDLIGRMAGVTGRLSRMATRLLDLQHLEVLPAVTVREPVPVGSVVNDAAGWIVPERDVTVTVRDESNAAVRSVDDDLLSGAVANLVENAVKHAPDGSEVLVVTTVGPGWVNVTVRDHGQGVPLEQRELIFRAFHQARPEDRRCGSGLGLAVVRRIAELHHGSVEVRTPDDGPGAEFALTLQEVT